MDRISGANVTDLGGGRRGFRDRNLGLGQAGTVHNAVYHNDLQEEVIGVIESAGIVPTAGVRNQLRQALDTLLRSRASLVVLSTPGLTNVSIPTWARTVRVRLWAGGGGGGGANGGGVASGGGAGGHCEGVYDVTPGGTLACTVGAGGAGGPGGAGFGNGAPGGTSSAGALCSATGGTGGVGTNGGTQQVAGNGGSAVGGQFNRPGAGAQPGAVISGAYLMSVGGAPHGGGYGPPVYGTAALTGNDATQPGQGGNGGIVTGGGGNGQPGVIMLEFRP